MRLFNKSSKASWIFPRSPGKSDKKIWRLFPGNGVLAVELRDVDNKEVEFAGLDLKTGAPLWQNLKLEEKWWVNINKIYQDVLLLQQFVRPDMPKAGKIFAVDLFTGKVLWQNEDIEFLDASGGRIYGVRRTLQSEELLGLNPKTGVVEIRLLPDDDQWKGPSIRSEIDEYSLPVSLDEADESSSSEIAMIKSAFPQDALAPTFVRSSPGSAIVGYHVPSGKDEKGIQTYDSRLSIIDKDGKVLYEDDADSKVYTTLQDFYFVVEQTLIYVRNSNEIVAVKL